MVRLGRVKGVKGLAAVGGSLLLAASPAVASRGVAIDLGRIDIQQKLTPGGAYRLPTMGVRNPGTETTDYELKASPLEMKGRRAPPESWFHFSPSRLTLKPKESTAVRVRIQLPTGADPGKYIALVGPQIVTKGRGAQVGAAAASRVTFTVEPASLLQAYWLKLKTLFSDHAPWSYLIPALLLATLLGWRIRRRFSFRIEKRGERAQEGSTR
jgi:hypothetical protein